MAELEIDLKTVVLSRPVLRRNGRREWFQVARCELESHRAQQAEPIARDRDDRMIDALERMEENQRVELAANEVYDRWRATARNTKGRVLKGNSKPYSPPELPESVINVSDPDSRVMRTQGTAPRQAYNRSHPSSPPTASISPHRAFSDGLSPKRSLAAERCVSESDRRAPACRRIEAARFADDHEPLL